MSAGASASASEDLSPGDEYEEMRQEIEATIAWIDDKLENGRIRDPERARARQGYLRLKIQAVGEWRKLKEVGDLEDLREELDALKDERAV
jgi:soluble cytochrome b562